MLFTSDNWAPVDPDIVKAMLAANDGAVPAYGSDPYTEAVTAQFAEAFGREVDVLLVATGSAANALALSAMVPPYGAVFCHGEAHVQMDECGAPEFFTGGAKLLPVLGENGKLTVDALADALSVYEPAMAHRVLPRAISVTQSTEVGTVYSLAELGAIKDFARSKRLKIHLDGARLGNACAHLGTGFAEMAEASGASVISFSGTKNGGMIAEALVVLDRTMTEELRYRQKRAGQVMSKARYLSAQWSAYLLDEKWRTLATAANARAAELSALLEETGFPPIYPVQTNEVFVCLPEPVADQLRQLGAQFYDWVQPGDPYRKTLRRFVTSFYTTAEDIKRFADALKKVTVSAD